MLFTIQNKQYALIKAYSKMGGTQRPIFAARRYNEETEDEWIENIKKLDCPSVYHSHDRFYQSDMHFCWKDFSLIFCYSVERYDIQDFELFRRQDYFLLKRDTRFFDVLYTENELDRMNVHFEAGSYDLIFHLFKAPFKIKFLFGYDKEENPIFINLKVDKDMTPKLCDNNWKISELWTLKGYIKTLNVKLYKLSFLPKDRKESIMDKYAEISQIMFLFNNLMQLESGYINFNRFLTRFKRFGKSRLISKQYMEYCQSEILESVLN